MAATPSTKRCAPAQTSEVSETSEVFCVAPCYNDLMDVGDIRFYCERWKAVEEIERQELRAASMETRWRQIDAIWRLAKGLGFSFEPDESEMEVFARWAKLKEGK